MIIYIDIDDTICRHKIPDNYESAYPIEKAVAKVNELYHAGNHIVMWTARGTVTGLDFEELTWNQLNSWGVMFSELKMGKPAYDLFIDDKNLNSKDWLDE